MAIQPIVGTTLALDEIKITIMRLPLSWLANDFIGRIVAQYTLKTAKRPFVSFMDVPFEQRSRLPAHSWQGFPQRPPLGSTSNDIPGACDIDNHTFKCEVS